MESNGKLLTIAEAAELYGINKSTIYKAIGKGKIQSETISIGSFQIKKVKKSDIERVFNDQEKRIGNFQSNSNWKPSNPIGKGESLKESIKEVITEYFQDKETKLIKPMEEMAIYRVGKLENEIKHLRAEKELILQDYDNLKEKIKALPGPVEEINQKIKQQDETIILLRKESKQLKSEKEKEQEIFQIEKETLEEKNKKQEQIIQEQKEHFQKEEKDYYATIEELKKQLEEEQNKPWWKKLW